VDPRVRTIITGTDGFADTIVTWGGAKLAGRRPRMVGRRSTGSRAMSACRMAPTRAPGRIAVSALLDRPHVTDDADDLGSGGDPFLGNQCESLSHHVARLHALHVERFQCFARDARAAVRTGSGPGKNEQPSWCDPTDADRQMASVHEMDGHRGHIDVELPCSD
jgi:hypothetical protein